jgi:UDP-glucose 4-epimerase
MRVLVTGGAGFIGSHIVDLLINEGYDVAVVDDLSSGDARQVNPKARLHSIDITDAQSLAKVFAKERPEVVSHHAAQTNVRHSMADPAFDARVNVVGSVSVLQLCADHGVRKLVFASTCAVYSEPRYLPMDESHPTGPQSAYGAGKLAVEGYLRLFADAHGLRYTTFRYGNVYGPRQDPRGEAGVVAIFTTQLLTGIQPTIFGDGNKTRDYVAVEDVAYANLLVLGDAGDNQVFNVAWGEGVSDFGVFNAVRKASGVTMEPLYTDRRPGEAEHVSLDCARARDQLGWTPTVQLREGTLKMVDAIRARPLRA